MRLWDLLLKIPSVALTILHTRYLKWRMGVRIGVGTRVYYKCSIHNLTNGCRVAIGSNCMIGRRAKGYHAGMPFPTTILNDGDNSSITIGNNCRINGAYIHAKKEISIGDNCVIASGVNIIDCNGHQVKSVNRTIGRDEPQSIIIGNNVWIGLNAVILKGTIIGDNCVIGAGTVVKGTFTQNSIIHNSPVVVNEISHV